MMFAPTTRHPYNMAPTPSTALHLIACVAGKGAEAGPARKLYRSDWFVKARRYCESWGFQWAILSAKHGLVLPDQIIEPYDETLLSKTRYDRLAWSDTVRAQVSEVSPTSLVLLAGRAYREPFNGWTQCDVHAPLARMGIGEQKQWLALNTLRDAR